MSSVHLRISYFPAFIILLAMIIIPIPTTNNPMPIIKILLKYSTYYLSYYTTCILRGKNYEGMFPQRSLSIRYKGRIAQMAINVAAILINDHIYFISIPFMLITSCIIISYHYTTCILSGIYYYKNYKGV